MSGNNVSFTAAAVGLGLVTASSERNSSHLVSYDVNRLTDFFVSEGVDALPRNLGYAFMQFLRALPSNIRKRVYAKIVTPGIVEHWALRKLMIDQQVAEAVNSGSTQIVIMGAGCDAQGIVWHKKYPHVNIFEVDYGRTQAVKKHALEKIKKKEAIAVNKLGTRLVNKYAEIGDNLHFVLCDLSKEDAIETLQEQGFDIKRNTIVIAEGFTMFLTREQLDSFFAKVHKIIGTDGRFVLSFSQPTKNSRMVADTLQKESQENFKSDALPNEVPEIMNKNSFNMYGKALFVDMQNQAGNRLIVDKHLKNPSLPKEDYYVVRRSGKSDLPQSIADINDIKLKIPAVY